MPIIGLSRNQLYEQPGRKIRRNRQGEWRIETSWICYADRMLDLMPEPGSEHPDFDFATLDEITGVEEEGELATIQAVYIGGVGSEESPEFADPEYEMVNALTQEPIETAPGFTDVTREEHEQIRKALDDPDSAAGIFDELSTEAQNLYLKKLRGQDSWLAPTHTWSESTASSVSLSSLAGIGTVSAPNGPAPNPAAGFNWLYAGSRVRRRGASWQITREWRLSGPGGWDPDVYT